MKNQLPYQTQVAKQFSVRLLEIEGVKNAPDKILLQELVFEAKTLNGLDLVLKSTFLGKLKKEMILIGFGLNPLKSYFLKNLVLFLAMLENLLENNLLFFLHL